MSIKEVKEYLTTVFSHITFNYNGFECGIDPFNKTKFEMWYGKDFITVNSIDTVVTTKLFDGKTLEEIWGHVTDVEF